MVGNRNRRRRERVHKLVRLLGFNGLGGLGRLREKSWCGLGWVWRGVECGGSDPTEWDHEWREKAGVCEKRKGDGGDEERRDWADAFVVGDFVAGVLRGLR